MSIIKHFSEGNNDQEYESLHQHWKDNTEDLSNKVIDNPNPIPDYILKEWIEKAKPLVDSAYNLAVDECLRKVYEMLKDLPEPNPLLIAITRELTKLKKPNQ